MIVVKLNCYFSSKYLQVNSMRFAYVKICLLLTEKNCPNIHTSKQLQHSLDFKVGGGLESLELEGGGGRGGGGPGES